jgi:hypothetical protein
MTEKTQAHSEPTDEADEQCPQCGEWQGDGELCWSCATIKSLRSQLEAAESSLSLARPVIDAAVKSHNWHWYEDCELCIALKPFRTDPRAASRISSTDNPETE